LNASWPFFFVRGDEVFSGRQDPSSLFPEDDFSFLGFPSWWFGHYDLRVPGLRTLLIRAIPFATLT